MYDIFDERAIETGQAAPPTRTKTPESKPPRRASFCSSSSSTTFQHHKFPFSMSRSSDPSLRRPNAMPCERPGGFEKNESSFSSRPPRPFVPKMKHMMPLILNSSALSPPKLESDGYNPHVPCLPPENIESTPRLTASDSRYREPATHPDGSMHHAKHLFDATDHVIMRMEFVRPPVNVEELWTEAFERWSQIHRKATADQWRVSNFSLEHFLI